MSADAQVRFIPAHDGQPSRREAWHDPDVNARCGNFLREHRRDRWSTRTCGRDTPGTSRFQTDASELAAARPGERTPHPVILERLQAAYARSRPAGAER